MLLASTDRACLGARALAHIDDIIVRRIWGDGATGRVLLEETLKKVTNEGQEKTRYSYHSLFIFPTVTLSLSHCCVANCCHPRKQNFTSLFGCATLIYSAASRRGLIYTYRNGYGCGAEPHACMPGRRGTLKTLLKTQLGLTLVAKPAFSTFRATAATIGACR